MSRAKPSTASLLPLNLSLSLVLLLHISPLELGFLTLLAFPLSLSLCFWVPLASELQVSLQVPIAKSVPIALLSRRHCKQATPPIELLTQVHGVQSRISDPVFPVGTTAWSQLYPVTSSSELIEDVLWCVFLSCSSSCYTGLAPLALAPAGNSSLFYACCPRTFSAALYSLALMDLI